MGTSGVASPGRWARVAGGCRGRVIIMDERFAHQRGMSRIRGRRRWDVAVILHGDGRVVGSYRGRVVGRMICTSNGDVAIVATIGGQRRWDVAVVRRRRRWVEVLRRLGTPNGATKHRVSFFSKRISLSWVYF